MNAYKIVKRQPGMGLHPWLKAGEAKNKAAYFYPINSAIFLEDTKNKDFMAVLPTQTYAGSAYQKGRIELLILR